MASLSMIIAESIGWRAMMFLCAIIGGAFAVLMIMTVTEPTRQGAAKKDDDKVYNLYGFSVVKRLVCIVIYYIIFLRI